LIFFVTCDLKEEDMKRLLIVDPIMFSFLLRGATVGAEKRKIERAIIVL